MCTRAAEKVNLNDVEAVKAVASSCMDTCGKLGVLPNFEALAAALGVCVPSAGYFGCLLPGEYVNATREDPDDAEGLNVYM